jgi:hypothetical protein
MSGLYNIWVDYYIEKSNLKQKLFIFFLLLRYTDISLFMKIEQDINYLRILFSFIFANLNISESKLNNKNNDELKIDIDNLLDNLLYNLELRNLEKIYDKDNKKDDIFLLDKLNLVNDSSLDKVIKELIVIIKIIKLVFIKEWKKIINLEKIDPKVLKLYMERVYVSEE